MRRTALLLLLLPGFVLATATIAEERDAALEYKVKAAFLANFAQFVEWPASALGAGNAPIIIGVLGDDPFGAVLEEAAARKTVNGRALKVKRYQTAKAAAEAQILYVSNSERDKFEQIAGALKGKPVLLVGDSAAFIQNGGMIRFAVRDERVQLDINPEAARRAGLRIASKLLKLAHIVHDTEDD